MCEILGRLRHPNVVQFLGVSYDTSSPRSFPLIVNELSPPSLATSITRYGVLPNEISYSIVRDVALGLRYLHERQPSFVHGDLSAKSVLLTGDFTAKISRVGVSHLVGDQWKTTPSSRPFYLPPEVTDHSKRFNRKVDVFSFGILMLHTFTGRQPIPKTATPSPERGDTDPSPSNASVKVLSQADMRVEYINDLGFNHPIMDSIVHCLRNQPILRPEIWEISQTLCKQAASQWNKFGDYLTHHQDILYSFEKERRKKFLKFTAQIRSLDSSYGSVSEMDVEELQMGVRRLSTQNETPQRLSLSPENMVSSHLRNNNRCRSTLLSQPLTPDNVSHREHLMLIFLQHKWVQQLHTFCLGKRISNEVILSQADGLTLLELYHV